MRRMVVASSPRVAHTVLGPSDGVGLLTVFVALMVLLPARLVVTPLGAVGQPALLVGLAALWYWTMSRLHPALPLDTGVQPARWGLLIWAWAMLLGYAVGHLRPLTALEASGSGRAVLVMLSLSGILLVTADGPADRARLDLLLRRLVTGGAVLATVGLIQFFTGFDPVSLIQLPGLSGAGAADIGVRSNFNRPYGTALHPIEFGVVLATLLPLALHYVTAAGYRAHRRRATVAAVLIAVGIPASVSRSAVLSLVACLLLVVAGQGWRQRANGALVGVAFTGVVWMAIPGLLGSLRSLFANAEHDPSVINRQERFPAVVELVRQAPWTGRGFGTYSPEDYFLLDNQVYKTAIEGGLIGVVAVAVLFGTGIVLAEVVRNGSSDDATRSLARAITAGLCAIAVSLFTFDAFFYRILTGTMVLLIGAAGCLWRLERAARPAGIVTLQVARS